MADIIRDIKELDCDKMFIHPNSPQLVNFVENKIPQIKTISDKIYTKRFTKSMVYRYVLLMYDPNSPIQEMHSLDWFEKKYEACAYAGFELNKKRDGYLYFDKKVEQMVMGENDDINDIIIFFLAWSNNSKWDYLVFLRESMLGFTRDAIGKKNRDAKTSKEYRQLYDDYKNTANELAHAYEEREEFVSRFYYQIEQSRLAIRPEDYAEALSGDKDPSEVLRADSPYGVNYIADKIRFVGESVPEDE